MRFQTSNFQICHFQQMTFLKILSLKVYHFILDTFPPGTENVAQTFLGHPVHAHLIVLQQDSKRYVPSPILVLPGILNK